MALVLPPSLREAAILDPVHQAMPHVGVTGIKLSPLTQYVFVLFTQRSGSFYLSDLLQTSGFFNFADEYLSSGMVNSTSRERNIKSIGEYFACISELRTRSGFFVLKSTIQQLAMLALHGILELILPRTRFIVIERMDKLAQVISWSIADQTGRYHLSAGQADAATHGGAPTYDSADLHARLGMLAHAAAQTTLFVGLNGLAPLHVSYEALIAAPKVCGRMINEFLGCEDVHCDPELVRFRRQASALNEVWRARFLSERTRLGSSA